MTLPFRAMSPNTAFAVDIIVPAWLSARSSTVSPCT